MKRFGLATALCAALAAPAGLSFAAGAAVSAPVKAQIAPGAKTALRLEAGAAKSLPRKSVVEKVVIDKPGIVSARMRDSRVLELTGMGPGEVVVQVFMSGRRNPDEYTVTVDKAGAAEAARVQTALRAKPGQETVQVEKSGPAFIIQGGAPDLESYARLSKMAETEAGDAPVVDMIQVRGSQMVAVDVRFYAVSAKTLKQLGFNFSYLGGDIQGALVAPGSLQSFDLAQTGLNVAASTPLQGAFNLLLSKPQNGALGVMSALSEAGLSQVLAQPTLLVRSGEAGDFLAGGDVPIPVPQGGGNSGAVGIEYRPYGVRLSASPLILSDRRIRLKLSPEVSELDYSNQITIQGTSIPGFRRRSTSTTVELGDGQSFVIAGLTYTTGANTESKVPGLGSLPVIGALFRASQVSRDRQELIIVVTPRIVSPMNTNPLDNVDIDAGKATAGDLLLKGSQTSQIIKRLGLSR